MVKMLVTDKRMNWLVARHVEVQDELDKVSARVYDRARANLAANHDAEKWTLQGRKHPKIGRESGRVDRYVYMAHPAAIFIEYGHGTYQQERPDGRTITVGAARGTRILRDAAGV